MNVFQNGVDFLFSNMYVYNGDDGGCGIYIYI